jgi:hypothetical protein
MITTITLLIGACLGYMAKSVYIMSEIKKLQRNIDCLYRLVEAMEAKQEEVRTKKTTKK